MGSKPSRPQVRVQVKPTIEEDEELDEMTTFVHKPGVKGFIDFIQDFTYDDEVPDVKINSNAKGFLDYIEEDYSYEYEEVTGPSPKTS